MSIDYTRAQTVLHETVLPYRDILLQAITVDKEILAEVHADGVDVSTAYDRDLEKNIHAALLSAFPHTGFVLEEQANDRDSEEYVWHIDPIDGTKYFQAGFSGFSCSVGLLKRGEPVFGYVYDFATGAEYCGSSAFPTSRNGKPIQVSTVSDSSLLAVAIERTSHYTGWTSDADWVLEAQKQLATRFYHDRMLGMGALTCAMVAGGFMNMGALVLLTGYEGTKSVDIAAGRALIRFAGGVEAKIPTPCTFGDVYVFGARMCVEMIVRDLENH